MEVSCSTWCHYKWQEAVDSGDEEAANNYLALYELWTKRGM
nr:MAG TPA: Stannin, MEMBRANE PROTEIN [Caudoviricetes sp.]